MRLVHFHEPLHPRHDDLWTGLILFVMLALVVVTAWCGWHLPMVQSYWGDLFKPGPIPFGP